MLTLKCKLPCDNGNKTICCYICNKKFSCGFVCDTAKDKFSCSELIVEHVDYYLCSGSCTPFSLEICCASCHFLPYCKDPCGRENIDPTICQHAKLDE